MWRRALDTQGPRSGIVVVSGSSSGMGEDAAVYLNGLGYTVLAGVRRDADGERVRARAERPDAFIPISMDVTDAEQLAGVAGEVDKLRNRGSLRLAGVFSNAGVAAYSGDVSCEGCPLETQQRVMDVDFFGGVRLVQALLPALRADRGTVVFNSALMARTVFPFNGGYAPAKAALEAFADALRRETRKFGIGVVIIEPAAIATSLGDRQDPSRIPSDTPYPEQRRLTERFLSMQKAKENEPALSPRRVSEIVAHAIASPNPKARYIAGGGSKLIWVIGALPDRLQDLVLGLVVAGGGR